MSWLFELHQTHPIAHAVGVLAFVCVLGMALESLQRRGFGPGTAGVLFAGFMDLSGLLAGSMTNPSALAFASNIARSDAPTVACATVFPLTTLLRIVTTQILALTLIRSSDELSYPRHSPLHLAAEPHHQR